MIVLPTLMLLFALTIVGGTQVLAGEMNGTIKKAIELQLKKHRSSLKLDNKRIYAYEPSSLKLFYKRRSFFPAWVSNGDLRNEMSDLLLILHDAELEGLNPADYNLDVVESAVGADLFFEHMDSVSLARVDVTLTDAFLHYASDLYSGRIRANAMSEEWNMHPRRTDLALVLQRALDSVGVRESLRQLTPKHRGYENLKKALAGYRSLSAVKEPPKITHMRRLAKRDSSHHVVTLRKRMSLWYPGAATENELFDDELEQAVKDFQKHHGLEPVGIVGKETIAALNLTNEDHIRQIIVNMERYRWLSEEYEDRYIAVNIPNFELCVVDSGGHVKTMRVVVGKSEHRTPVLSNAMTYIVLSPYWHVPQDIAANEILPKMAKDSSYLEKENIRVFKKEGKNLSPVDPGSLDSTSVKDEKLRFRMEPGTKNSLGRVKFMFPNYNNVYLHDTPAKSLFNKTMRYFSHGCVRVEQPIELAAHLLGKDTAWVNEAIGKASGKGEERVVRLPEPIQVHLQYLTAWVDDAGSLQFRKDIYEWDSAVSKALRGEPTHREKHAFEQFASRLAKRSATTSMQ